MSTKIEWTDEVWNVVTGCTHSGMPGCDNCYARRLFPRVYSGDTTYIDGYGLSEPPWRPRRFEDVKTHPDRLDKPLHWRKPRRVFTCSMGDLFHKDVPDEFIAAAWDVMSRCDNHTFQVLTKRPGRAREILTRFGKSVCGDVSTGFGRLDATLANLQGLGAAGARLLNMHSWPHPNIWLGASASTQPDLDRVMRDLVHVPAAVRFLSLEPMIERIEIRGELETCNDCDRCIGLPGMLARPEQCHAAHHVNALHPDGIHWVIVGCESGPKRRPMKIEWARSVVEQCRAAGVPVFVKQLDIAGRVSKNPDEWPVDLRVRDMPK